MSKHIRPPAECIGHNHWWEKRDSNSQSTRARHFKCRVYSVPPFSHIGWLPPPMDVFQFGPRSAKEPYFFLLTSRADLDESIYSIQREALFSYGLFGKTGTNRTHASLIWSQSILPIIRRPQNLRPPIRTLRPCYNVANM